MNVFKKLASLKTIWAVLLLALFAQGEELYNGIRVEGAWPPARALSRAYRPVPYLENRPDVVLIDIGRQLFVDDFLIESTTLKRRFHQPRMHPENPVIRSGIAGQEKYAFAFSDGIFYDPQMKLFRAWYRCDANTCYATSTDGVKWERPELDVVPGTNIVRKGMRDSTSIWLDLNEKDPAKRHKMMVFTSGRLDDAIHFEASPDGIHWGEALGTGRTYKQPNYDRSSMFFNPFRNRWIYSVRVSNVGPLSAPELPPGIGRTRYYKEVENFAEGWKERQELAQWESADERDLPDPVIKALPQLYNLDATPYESLMLGLFSIWRGPENAEVKDRPKRNEIVLGYSRDGFHWDRPDRRPFIGVSEKRGDWNWGNVQSVGGGCVVVGDNLYFYFSGRRGNPSGATGGNADGDASTGLAVLRRDGFASMDAAGEGVLLTRKLRFSGAHLFVNADAKRGSIVAEMLDVNGHVLEPFSRKNSIAVKQDGTKLALSWKGGRSLAELAGKDVSIRFHVRDASLYAFWVSPTPAGESRGFLAAGSMGDAAFQDLP